MLKKEFFHKFHAINAPKIAIEGIVSTEFSVNHSLSGRQFRAGQNRNCIG